MVAGEAAHRDSVQAAERQFPPIAPMAVGSLGLIVIGGIYLASQIPRSVTLWPAVGLLALAAVLVVANGFAMSRLEHFAWDRFAQVFQWTLLAYLIIAGMIGYVFIDDGTRGGVLLVLIGMLAIFAVDIPLLLAFSVARFQEVD